VFAEHRPSAPGIPTDDGNASTANQGLASSTRVLIISSVLFTFIGAWRTAAVVLCDLASDDGETARTLAGTGTD
jgi:hypothetical protein